MSLWSKLLSSAGIAPLSDPLGQWRQGVSRGLDGLLTYTFFPQLRIPTGLNAPTQIEAGPTIGWTFALPGPNYIYSEVPLHPQLDRNQNMIIGLAWAPAGSEAAKTASWRLAIGFEKLGSTVTVVDETIDVVDAAVPTSAAVYTRSAFVVTPAMFAAHDGGTDELHIRLTRIASSADPVADPGAHHIAVIQRLAA